MAKADAIPPVRTCPCGALMGGGYVADELLDDFDRQHAACLAQAGGDENE